MFAGGMYSLPRGKPPSTVSVRCLIEDKSLADLETLLSSSALRCVLSLEPIDGFGGRVFPPTYPEGPRHVVETYHADGRNLKRVLVDSVASQANRHENALVTAHREGRIQFPDLLIDLSNAETPLENLFATELPHRLADAIMRDSEIGGVPFGDSELGKSILTATPQDLTPILEASPTTLIYGAWFSQWKTASRLKLQRLCSSEIWAYDAVLGYRVGSRIDPLGIVKVDLYDDGKEGWTADPEEAVKGKGGTPKLAVGGEKPSKILHGNIAPSLQEGLGITAASYELRWSFSIAALKRYEFGGQNQEERRTRAAAAHQYLIALALTARALADEAGYALRSRCDLLRSSPHEVQWLEMSEGGLEVHPTILSPGMAMDFLKEATKAARDVGFKLDGTLGPERTLIPGERLIKLIQKSAEKQAAVKSGEELEEE